MTDDRKSTERTQSYRARRRAAGDKLVTVWLTPESQRALEDLRKGTDMAIDTIVGCALQDAAQTKYPF